MCNQLHPDSKPIPEEGVGWKLFETNNFIYDPGKRLTWNRATAYTSDKVKVVWRLTQPNKGFCFFLSKAEAYRFKDFYNNPTVVLRKIHYKGGLGKHMEPFYYSGDIKCEVALCRSFTLSKTAQMRGEHF